MGQCLTVLFSARSAEIGGARVKKMVARDKLLSDLKAEATSRASAIAQSPQYPQIITKLITQVFFFRLYRSYYKSVCDGLR